MQRVERAEPLAIIGIGCRFPGGANSPATFWKLVTGGVDAITEVPPGRFDLDAVYDPDPTRVGKLYSRWGGYVDTIDSFDAEFFGVSPREARRIDPQQRMLLEVAWEALEDAGQPPPLLAGSRTGVFVGISSHDYGDMQFEPVERARLDAHVATGGAGCIAANRISYCLDLRGPSLAVDTACSSSLTALHLAGVSLAHGECELALVGGVNALLAPTSTIMFCKANMLSPDGRCKPFDARANGYVRAEGAGAIVLKPLNRALRDGDPIYAVMLGSAINQDGHTTGLTVPNPAAQQELLRDALRAAGVSPTDVQYVEAHGTGTAVGDPREAEAIGRVFSVGRAAHTPCLIGSVKGNIGHLEAGAGIAGVIKTALALKQRTIPPTLHFAQPNPAIAFDELALRVPVTLQHWPAAPGKAIAGVNSFGFGGANAHVILGEAPTQPPVSVSAQGNAVRVLTLSARTTAGLREHARAYRDYLQSADAPSFADVCYTAAARRAHHEQRLAVVAADAGEAVEHLNAWLRQEPRRDVIVGQATSADHKLAFVFAGMGPQWWGMGRELMAEEPVFRGVVEECDALLSPLAGWSLLDELRRDENTSRVTETDRVHVANFALQVALAALWRSWGVTPHAVVGHSSGEMAAAYVAGALSLRDGVRLAWERGRLQHRTTGTGGMLAAGVSNTEARALVHDYSGRVDVAAVNGPASVTLSGDVVTLEQIAASLRSADRFCRLLPVRVPYHGPQMDALHADMLVAFSGLAAQPAHIPLMSSVTASWLNGEVATAEYWWQNVRQPVLFADAIAALARDGHTTFIEMSPHPVLTQSIGECATSSARPAAVLPTLRRAESERRALLRTLGAIHAQGYVVDWSGRFADGATCVSLPSYPWQRERYWLDPSPSTATSTSNAGSDTGHPLLGRRLHTARPLWEAELTDARLVYFAGHVVGENVTVPGAAYIETMLAAARTLRDSRAVLEDVEFHKLLALTGEAVTLQCAGDEQTGTLTLHSALHAEGQWTLRASGRLGAQRPHTAADTLEALRSRCAVDLDIDGFYDVLAQRHRLRYRDVFRCVRELRQGRGEALGHVVVGGLREQSGAPYSIHPALLDGAFQVMLAAISSLREPHDQAGEFTVLPVGAARVASYTSAGAEIWSHVTAERRRDGDFDANVRVYAADGTVALECRGLRLKVVERVGADNNLLHLETWQPAPRAIATPVPLAHDIVAAVTPTVQTLAGTTGVADYYTLFEPALNALTARYVHDALHALGYDRESDEGIDDARVADRLRVLPRHHRFFARLLDVARRFPIAPDDATACADARCECAFTLVHASGERLARTLTGAADAREWLFDGAMLRALHDMYATGPTCLFYNALVAEVVAAAMPRGRPVRILEIGAGTGSTTAAVLQRLRDVPLEYVVTDVSPFFLNYARSQISAGSHVRFDVLDIERPRRGEGGFDIIIAANVVHATADVRATLANMRGLLGANGAIVLMEIVRPAPWIELIFGQLEGWWRFADNVRTQQPLLDVATWIPLLSEDGFAAHCVADQPSDGGAPNHAVLLARAPATTGDASATTAQHWIVLADQQGVAERVIGELSPRYRCTCVAAGTSFAKRVDGSYELDATQAAHWSQLLQELRSDDAQFAVLHLSTLDLTFADDLATVDIMSSVQRNCASVAALLRAAEASSTSIAELRLVTAGATAPITLDQQCNPLHAALWGVGGVLRREQPSVRCQLIDLGADLPFEDVTALIAELLAPVSAAETELALRGTQRFVRDTRTVSSLALPQRVQTREVPVATPFRLEIGLLGALDTLRLRETPRLQPGPGEVAIRVSASGLNFRDVLTALGLLSELEDHELQPLGGDCAGVVEACGPGVTHVRPGDEVVAMVSTGFGSIVMARAELVVLKPECVSFEEAATLPAAFVTVRYALERFAQLAANERVLIHAAAGGVGMAAIQVARRIGAEIIVTAGTPEKRAYLKRLGIEHVLDSRTLDFADDVMRLTAGAGVDVVLNSLSGAALVKGFDVLRRYGRFIEIGRRDIMQNAQLGLRPFDKGLSLYAFELRQLIDDRSEEVGAVLRTVIADVARGELTPLPCTTFDLANAEQAFRFMAQGRHIGKIVLTVHKPRYPVAARAVATQFRPDATYLITGGLGGFGLAVAEWMVASGAQHVVLMGRSGVPRAEDEPALQRLLQAGANVVVLRADVADTAELARVLNHVRTTMPPLCGVFHAAMVLADELMTNMTEAQLKAALAPKVAGAWNLHQLTRADPLDMFVLFSSGVSLVGIPKQANYAAGNAFLDSLALYRRRLGLPAVAINWGAIEDVGFVARHPEVSRHLTRRGIGSITAGEACAALGTVLQHDVARVAVGRIDWSRWRSYGRNGEARTGEHDPDAGTSLHERLLHAAPADRHAIVLDQLARRAAHVLGTAPERVELDRSLTDMGLDSLMAVEYRTALRVDLGVEIELLALLEGLTLRKLAHTVLEQLAPAVVNVA